MKNTVLALFAFAFSIQAAHAQCSTCTPAFQTCPPNGGLCNRLDTAYANHPYDKQINFFMPQLLTDPTILALCQCNSVSLRHITVAGASGLPGGINYVISNNSYFDVENGDSVGCAHFCGTPLVPGLYSVTVHLFADVTAHGTPIGDVQQNNVAQQYIDTLLVLPDTVVGVSTFTYGNNGYSACDSITIDLHANKTAPAPNMTRWYWDIAGTPYEGKDPGTYHFTNTGTEPDTFDVILNTVWYQYKITNINIFSINGGWYSSGDWNETTSLQDPEPYMILGALGATNDCNNAASSTTTPSWSSLNIPVPMGTSNLTMDLWEDDLCGISSTTIALFGLADDHLETMTCTVGLGLQVLAGNNNNANGSIRFDTIPGIVLTDTLHVIVNPTPLMPTIVASADTFCSTDSVRLSLDHLYDNCTYEWYRDTVYLNAYTDSAFYTNIPGNYRVKVTNQGTGCQITSDWKTITRITSPAASINIIFNGTQCFVTPFPVSGYSVDWFYNGNFVPGQHGKFLNYLGNGLYEAQVYSTAFPSCRTIANPDSVSVSGVEEVTDNGIYQMSVFPNPNNGNFTLAFSANEMNDVFIRVENTLGEIVYESKTYSFNGEFREELRLENATSGVYFVTVENALGRKNLKLIVQ